jgi:hypothetical protein
MGNEERMGQGVCIIQLIRLNTKELGIVIYAYNLRHSIGEGRSISSLRSALAKLVRHCLKNLGARFKW